MRSEPTKGLKLKSKIKKLKTKQKIQQQRTQKNNIINIVYLKYSVIY